MKRVRRIYENTALVAVRKARTIALFWARRCRKSTNLGNIAFDEMTREAGRTVIAASASLLLGTELVGSALSATEQAAIVAGEAAAVRTAVESNAEERGGLDLRVANTATGKELTGLGREDFADLYRSSRLEMRLYHDQTTYSRLKVIAPNPATARGWGGTVMRDEAGFTPAALETELQIAVAPIIDTDPTFKLIYASNLPRDDRHPFFEMTLPPADVTFTPRAAGNFYRGQNGILIHRVSLADAYEAGHVLYDSNSARALTLAEFRANPANKLQLPWNYDLEHQFGGTAAIDLLSLLTAQRRGAQSCAFVFVEGDADFRRALDLLRVHLGGGDVCAGFDVATTEGGLSNPSSVTITERNGIERAQRLVVVWKEKKPQIVRQRLKDIVRTVKERREGGPMRRLCIDASNERYFAEETADELREMVPVELVINSVSVQPPGYTEPTNYKTWLGDLYSTALNDNRYALPSAEYIKSDHRLPVKNQGRYGCTPDHDGKHGDTFDSGKLAEYGFAKSGGPVQYEGIERKSESAHSASREPQGRAAAL